MLCIRWQHPEPEIHREIKQEFKKEGRKLLLRATITILQNVVTMVKVPDTIKRNKNYEIS